MNKINFFAEEIDFSLSNEPEVIAWILDSASMYSSEIQNVNYVFCTDDYLLEVNKKHLNHDFYTDIITFDLTDIKGNPIEADIFISIDRVRENAKKNEVEIENELYRVMIHGILHLVGFKDKTKEEAMQMRAQEDKCLSLFQLMRP